MSGTKLQINRRHYCAVGFIKKLRKTIFCLTGRIRVPHRNFAIVILAVILNKILIQNLLCQDT